MFFKLFCLTLSIACVGLSLPQKFVPLSTGGFIQRKLPQNWSKTGIFTFPEARRIPWQQAIFSAKQSLKIAAYRLSDPTVLKTLQEAKSKNPKLVIDLLIEPDTKAHGKTRNDINPIETLKKMGVRVHTLSERFNQAHYKLIIVDDTWAMISTGNLDAESFDGEASVDAAPCRDFAVTITQKKIIKELDRVFQADIQNKRVVPTHPQLVWGPSQPRHVFLDMINGAQKSIHIYQQDFQDEGIARAVAGAAKAGVKVQVMMMPFPFGGSVDRNKPNQDMMEKAGATIHLNKKYYMHAKVLLVDADTNHPILYVGSCNFYPSALDQTRELGVLTNDRQSIRIIQDTFKKDQQS